MPLANIHEFASRGLRSGTVTDQGPEPLTAVIFACSWNEPAKHTRSPTCGDPGFPFPEFTVNVMLVVPTPIAEATGVFTSVARVPQKVEGVTVMSVLNVPGVNPLALVLATA